MFQKCPKSPLKFQKTPKNLNYERFLKFLINLKFQKFLKLH
jgi:hypothetical protein